MYTNIYLYVTRKCNLCIHIGDRHLKKYKINVYTVFYNYLYSTVILMKVCPLLMSNWICAY